MSISEIQQEINKKNYKFWHLDIFDDNTMIDEITGEMPSIQDFDKKKDQIDKQIQKVTPELRQFYCEPLLSKEHFLVRCNTRLAAKVLKKRKDYYGDNINDLISDCFINIIKAVDGFDFRRGFKFSTYCI